MISSIDFGCGTSRNEGRPTDGGTDGRNLEPRVALVRRARGLRGFLFLLGALWLVVSTATAQVNVETTADDSDLDFVLLRPTRHQLSDFQERWIDWVSAVRGGDRMGAETAAELIQANAAEFGFVGLPDLSLGAAGLARSLAREGATERAAIAMGSAEIFDPGRPETRITLAEIQREDGKRIRALRSRVSGWVRALRSPRHSRLLLGNLAIWFATVVHVAGGLFVCVLMATRGSSVVQGVMSVLEDHVSPWLALILVVIILLWPITLPGGLAWLFVYWSVLLWSHGGRAERVILGFFWLFVALSPIAVEIQGERVEVGLSPSARVLGDLGNDRLSGRTFLDLAEMSTTLPDNVAVEQVRADVHRRLRQWAPALGAYSRVIESEPDNTKALTGLGLSYLRRGDSAQAADAFRRATTDGPPQAEAFFHLSTLFSGQYDFSQSRVALENAREIDREGVDVWVSSSGDADHIAPDGGFERGGEIQESIARRWRGESDVWKQRLSQLALSLPVAAVFLLLAVLLHVLQRSTSMSKTSTSWWSGSVDRWRRTLIPGLAEAEAGQWIRALLWVLVFVGLAAIPITSRVGYVMPWGGGVGWLSVILALLVCWGVRAFLWWRA